MKKIQYSKKRLMKQARIANMTSKIMPKGTVLTVLQLMKDVYTDDQDNEHPNDYLVLSNQDGAEIKLSIREFNKMKMADNAKPYTESSDDDMIDLPNEIHIADLEPRQVEGEDEPRYATFAYKLAKEFIESKGKMPYPEMIAGGRTEPCHFEPLQNYTITVK
jgi:hypothetical protein